MLAMDKMLADMWGWSLLALVIIALIVRNGIVAVMRAKYGRKEHE